VSLDRSLGPFIELAEERFLVPELCAALAGLIRDSGRRRRTQHIHFLEVWAQASLLIT